MTDRIERLGEHNALLDRVHAKGQAARGQRECTGDPNTCGLTYRVAAAPEEPICSVDGVVCALSTK